MANKRYTSSKNDFCLNFDQNADIQEVENDRRIQTITYSFTPIGEMENLLNNTKVDAIGVIVEAQPVVNVNMKNG